MNKILFTLATIFTVCFASGCYADAQVEPVYVEQSAELFPSGNPTYGCTIITDDLGEREVCNVYYYPSGIYWDPYLHIWCGGHGYWYGGVWHRGFYPGYVNRYRGYYRPHGYYHGHFNGGHSYHSGGHAGGGYHGGGFHGGGHGGHR